MSEVAKWYVVHTYAGYENKVANNIEKIIEAKGLNELIIEIRIPTETIIEIKNNKKKETKVKLFPSYVFINMVLNDDTWYVVKNTRGVTGFVGVESKPEPLTEAEMECFKIKAMKQHVVLNYGEGDIVNIINGTLEGYEGTIENINQDKGTAKVSVSMFGRKTLAEIELKDIEALS